MSKAEHGAHPRPAGSRRPKILLWSLYNKVDFVFNY